MVSTQSFPRALLNFVVFGIICIVAVNFHLFQKIAALFRIKKKNDKDSKLLTSKKLVVISGCDRGLGRLLAEALKGKQSYFVLALTLTDEAAKDLRQEDQGIFTLKCDVTSPKDVEAVKKYVESFLQKEKDCVLYTLVNNAGITSPGDCIWFPNSLTHEKIMNVNYFGALRLTQALLPLFVQTSRQVPAKILNNSSVCGKFSGASKSAYHASKFALEAWSDSLRIELEPFSIAVVNILPGQVGTDMIGEYFNGLISNFENAPSYVHELYGGKEFYKKVLEDFKESASEGPMVSDPSIVIDLMLKIVLSPNGNLNSFYWVGNDAHTLWKALYALPASVSYSFQKLLYTPAKSEVDTGTGKQKSA